MKNACGMGHPGLRLAMLLGLVAGTALFGQSTAGGRASAPAAAKTSTVSAQVNEVSLDLVAHNKKHKLVMDLKPDELAVTDDGVPVKLTGFHLVTGDSGTGHLVTLVFDHFQGSAARSAENLAGKILKMLPSKGFSVAVLDLNGRLRLIQGFTEDRKAVEQAIQAATAKDESRQTKAAAVAEKNLIAVARTGADTTGQHASMTERAEAQALLAALADSHQIVQDRHARVSLAALLALARSQQQMKQRKTLVYFTHNPQMDSAAKAMVQTIVGAANRASVRINTIDMNAFNSDGQHQLNNAMLNGQAPFSPAAQPVPGSGGMASSVPMQQAAGMPGTGGSGANWGTSQDVAMATGFMMRSNEWATFNGPKGPMADLAKGTGGTYIDAQDRTKKPLERMREDMTTYYEATYVPPIQDYDGKFRTIGVRPLRKDLNIQTRTGYYALPPGADGSIQPFEAPLLKALSAPQLPADLKFGAEVLRLGKLPDGNANSLVVSVPVAELDTKQDQQTGLYSARVAIVAQIRDSSGTVVEHFGEDLTHRGALESLDRNDNEEIALQRHFYETPGAYVLQVAVLDQNSGKMSAERVAFEIPAVKAGPAVSDMVLVKSMHPVAGAADPLEPMRYAQDAVTANISGEVPGGDKDVSLFFILHPDPNVTAAPALEMQVIRNGKPGRRTPLPLKVGKTPGSIPYLASFQGKALAPGEYEVKAILQQGEATAVQSVAFTVEGSGASTAAVESEAATAMDVKYTAPVGMKPAPGQLTIKAVSNAAPRPSVQALQDLIADARQRAVHYTESLPNFLCVQVTDRSVDREGRGNWKQKDTITELLRYRQKVETRTTLEVNGKASNTERDAMPGTFSSGELGGVLRAVFEDTAHADFRWKETDALEDGTVQVFAYSVDQAHSAFGVTGSNGRQILAAFHGEVFLDTATHSVRRITLIADKLPRKFPTHYTAMRVDYGYVMINGHDYLMPVSAEVSVEQGRHEAVLNSIQFRDYRRFGSSMKILNFVPATTP